MDTPQQYAPRAARGRRRLPADLRADTRTTLTRLAAAALVAGLVAATATAAEAGPTKSVTCKVQTHNVAPPSAASGEEFGTVTCPSVFGNGVVHDSFTVTPASKGSGTVSGRFKEFFDTGTIHGTFKLEFTAASTGGVTSSGTAAITGGTGAYKRAKGSVKVECKVTTDTRNTCIEKRTLTLG